MTEDRPVASSLPGEAQGEESARIPQGPKAVNPPSPEEQFKAWVLDITQRVQKMEEENGQMRKLMDDVNKGLNEITPILKAQKEGQGGNQGMSLMEIIKEGTKIFNVGGGDEATYAAIGHRVMDGVLDTTVKKVVRELGGEAAGHVVLKE